MAHFQVYWQKGKEGRPLASHWYTLGGVVVWASPVLIDWVGKLHSDLMLSIYEGTGDRPSWLSQPKPGR